MNRRTFLCRAVSAALVTPLAAEAQPAGKVYRIGVLSASGTPTPPHAMLEIVRQTLKELGNGEGTFDRRYAEGHQDRLPALAAELVQLKPNVIIAVSTPAIRAVKNVTSTVPIVMGFIGEDPVTAGIVASLARPGGNVTGITIVATDLAVKRLQLLRDALPGVAHIATLTDGSTNVDAQIAAAQEGVRRTSVKLHVVQVEDRDYERAFALLAQRRAEALFVPASTVFFNDRSRILKLAAKHRLPGIYEWREMANAGGLMSYGPQYLELSRRVAFYVDKILKGTKPGDLPVEQPTTFELVINLRTAKALGLTIPPSLLGRADQVIE